jgi:hypothetical protein
MKIKLDENLTVAIVPVLKKLGHDVQTTIEEGLKGKLDQDSRATRRTISDDPRHGLF